MINSKGQGVVEVSSITCPSCGHEVDVEKLIEHQTEERLRGEYNQKFIEIKRKLEDEKKLVERERLEVKQLSSQTWAIIQEELKKERLRLTDQMKAEAKQHMHIELGQLNKALEEKQRENLQLQKKEVEMEALKQKLENQQEKLKLQLQREFLNKQQETERSIKSQYVQQQDFMKLEYEKKLTDQRTLIDEMTRKMEQGSMQLQGEVQEWAIENYLRENFLTDEIESIKAGARGADCIQIVREVADAPESGRIYFESKRTKHFQNTWIEKFKGDMRNRKADVGILVTEAMPSQMDHMGQKDGVWICSIKEMKVLVPILRESILLINQAKEQSIDQESKMALLYQFLMSSEFRMQVEGIVEGFTELQEELNREKRAMHSIWKRREKQIEKVLINTNHMYSSIKGLAGNEIQSIDALELDR